MKRQKKIIFTCALGLSLLTVAVPSFAAKTAELASGGWSESEGYYNNSSSDGVSALLASSSTPDSHIGQRLTRNVGSSASPIWEDAAYGKTVWYNVPHYTTARMELSDGTVKTTSGRVYNNSSWVSEATSPYYRIDEWSFENTEARTYWGQS
ncbi:hypothetical protein [Paenibacillus durus]|uniref:hypothetical protein n=1 Tax=Paenibacillus durus TaxID=44251 RepID=UPI0012E091C0|nr:hypothetical protein [Paenibacillus durus]